MEVTEMTTASQAYNFLLYCYFGDTSDPIEAAIDRAYADMAAHTLKGFPSESSGKSNSLKWACRYQASKKIKKAVRNIGDDFEQWHKSLCLTINGIYESEIDTFSYGQAQKWINMTTKYLFVLYLIFEDMNDPRKNCIPEFFRHQNKVLQLHVPLDNYLLQYYGKSRYAPWSKMNECQYQKCHAELNKTAEDELVDWVEAAEMYRTNNNTSYAYYKKQQELA